MATAVAKGESQWGRRQGRFKNLKQTTEGDIAGRGEGRGQGYQAGAGRAEPYRTERSGVEKPKCQ
jgi:hypothetical protein